MLFLDLKKQYRSIKKEVDRTVQKVLDSGQFILGQTVEIFEEELAKYCRIKYAIGVNSGTDALLLSLMALDIGPDDEVITTPFTFIATAEVIALRGAKPVFVDIDPKTFNIDADKIEEKITKKTKAIIPVHLFGQPAEMEKIMKIAKKRKLYVIEDAAQAIGAKYKRKIVGSFGTLGCLSFFPSKNLGAYGDGGAVLTNNKQLCDRIKMLRVHGSQQKYLHSVIGINSRLDALQAAILRIKLKHLNKWTELRQKKAQIYNWGFSKIKGVTIPFVGRNNLHIYHQYTLKVKNRDKLQQYLKESKIPFMIYYPVPLHLQPAFKYLGYKKGAFPVAEEISQQVISLPIYPEITKKEQQFIIQIIKKFFK